MTESVKEIILEKQPRLFTDESLAAIDSFDAVLALVRAQGLATANASDLGNGFVLLANKDKPKLIGVSLVILDWRFNAGDHGEFVSMMVLTKDGKKYIVNDGSTGIYENMKALTRKLGGGRAVTYVPKGFTQSDYMFDEVQKDGSTVRKPATTFYLSFEKDE